MDWRTPWADSGGLGDRKGKKKSSFLRRERGRKRALKKRTGVTWGRKGEPHVRRSGDSAVGIKAPMAIPNGEKGPVQPQGSKKKGQEMVRVP